MRRAVLLLLLLSLTGAARAQVADDASGAQPDAEVTQATDAAATPSEQADPPSRVVRLSALQGNVSVEPASVNEFTPAEVNQVLTSGDRIYTDNGANVELQSGQIVARMGAGTDLTVTAMTDLVAQFGLAGGAVHLRSFAVQPGSVLELDTPEVALTVLQPGDLRVDEDAVAHMTTVTVVSGQVQMDGPQLSRQLNAGDRVRVAGANLDTGEQASLEPLPSVPSDALDAFSGARDDSFQAGEQAAGDLLNPETTGSADLAANGTWDTDQDVGPVWFPVVAVGWRPYYYGHWRWVAPWGWTWVGAEPWAFAPFHYGRWIYLQGRWGWVPGVPALRPVYVPALVAFVGGKEFSASLGYAPGSGIAAWFPLGPREPFAPWYHGTIGYLNRVNASNIYTRNVQEAQAFYHQRAVNAFVNGELANPKYINRIPGTVAISQASFAGGQPVAKNQLHIPVSTLAQAPLVAHPTVSPERWMVVTGTPRAVPPSFATATRSGLTEPNATSKDESRGGVVRRPEFFHTVAPPAPRASFEEQRQAMQRTDPGRPASTRELESMHTGRPAAATSTREAVPRSSHAPAAAAPHK